MMFDCHKHCPSDGTEQRETFCLLNKVALKKYAASDEPLSNAEINKHLKKLNSTLRAMPKQIIHLLRRRESDEYPKHPREAWFENLDRVRDGGSAMDMLIKISKTQHKHPTHADAVKRHALITDAILAFKMFGGEIQSGAATPFGKYLFDLFIDAGIENADISKVISDYTNKVTHTA
jgi:hypothetical protein